MVKVKEINDKLFTVLDPKYINNMIKTFCEL